MKKLKIIIIAIASICLIFFIISVYKIIKSFDTFTRLSSFEGPYSLSAKEIQVINSRTDQPDTLQFVGVNLVNFWASWCTPCLSEQPSLEKLQSQKKNIKIIQISFDSISNQKAIFHKYQWKLPAFFLSDTSVFKIPELLPVTYIIKDNIVLEKIYGAKKWTESGFISLIDSLSR